MDPNLTPAAVGIAAAVFAGWWIARSSGEPDAAGGVTGSFTQLTSAPGEELFPSLSPDGRLLAYSSWAQGQNVFTIRFPQGTDRRHVAPGRNVRWDESGDELFYLNGRDMMAVTATSTRVGTPVRSRTL